MSELKRLLDDDADDLERALLLSAREDTSPDGAHARALGALGVAAPALVHAASVAAGGSAATAGGAAAGGGAALQSGVVAMIVKWLGIGLLAGTVTSGGLVAAMHARARSTGPAAQPLARAAVDRPPVMPRARTAPAAPPASAPHAAQAARVALVPRPSAGASAPPDVSEELALLDRARRDLARGDASAALAVLTEHDRRFRSGELGPEAEVLRVEALLAAGRRAEAARLARILLAKRPHSPYKVRLRRLLGRAASGGTGPAPVRRAAAPSPAPSPAVQQPSDRATPSNVASFPANE